MRSNTAVLSLLLASFSAVARADDLLVPAQYPTVQSAIDAAASGDAIIIAPGIYREHLNLLGKAITLRSTDPSDDNAVASTVLSGDLDADGLPDGVIIRCVSGETSATVIDGLTIRDGLGAQGGAGISIEASAPVIRRCRFTSFDGPAVYAMLNAQTLTVESSTFTDTSLPGTPGAPGIYVLEDEDSTLVVTDCSFVRGRNRSSGSAAGAIDSEASYNTITGSSFVECDGTAGAVAFAYYSSGTKEALVEDCTFTRNTAWAGGAINILRSGMLIVTDSLFEENYAEVSAGAINSWRALVIVQSSEFVHNGFNPATGAITELGGAIEVGTGVGTGNLFVDNSVFRSNTAILGGAVSFGNRSAIFRNSEFVGNSASNCSVINTTSRGTDIKLLGCTLVGNVSGGVMVECPRPLVVYHCAIGDNTVGNDGLFSRDTPQVIAGSVFLESPSLSPETSVKRSIVPGGWVGEGNIDADPMIFRLPSDGGDGWGDNFATPEVDESLNDDAGDFAPLPGSAMIDAGDSSLNPLDTRDWDDDGDTTELIEFAIDNRGAPRAVDDPSKTDAAGVPTPAIDIGPVEHPPSPCPADTNGDGSVTAADFSAWIAAFNDSAPACDQNGDGLCTAADFSAWIANFNAGC